MSKLNLLYKKNRTILSLILITALLMMVFMPIQKSAAAPIANTPSVVNGRVLPANMTGDTSDWIEIAQNGDYSLIVRKNFINWYSQPSKYGNPDWQYVSFGATNAYASSNVRTIINNWFNNRACTTADNLPANARLRSYTISNNAINVLGTSCNPSASLTDGYSKPTTSKANTGNDVAFALSYGEAANFCSKIYFMRGNIANLPSSPNAISNFNKINFPIGYPYGMWLRSPGDISYTAAAMNNNFSTTVPGRVFQFQLNSGTYGEWGLIYPALWVDSTIFETAPTTYSITYVLNGGVHSETPASYTTNNLPLAIVNPSRTGYPFQHWMATCANGSQIILPASGIPAGTVGNITLTAIWGSPIQYSITYVLNGGALAPGYPTTYNVANAATVNTNTVGTPTFAGYKFVNWRVVYSNGTMFTLSAAGIPAGSTGDVTIVAMWDPVPIQYSINYVLDGGVNAAGNPTSYTVAGIFPVNIANPSKTGYEFLGWVVVYTNGTTISLTPSYSIPAGTTGDVMLSALWAPTTQYSINYVLDGGVNAAGNPTSYTASALPLNILVPSRSGYVFSHWILRHANGAEIILQNGVIPAGTTGDVTLIAVWSAVQTYSINYALNGGVNAAGNPTSYTVENTFPINIAAPSMTSYTFLYWVVIYADGTLGILPSSGIPAGTTGNITLVAVWYP